MKKIIFLTYIFLIFNFTYSEEIKLKTKEDVEIEKMEAEMAGNGRILVRPSGTEPLLRVMAEAPTDDEVNYYVDTIADVVRAEIGLD